MDLFMVTKMILPTIIITLGVLGWFIIIAFAVLLSIINKYIGVIGILFLVLLGFEYFTYYASSNSTSIYYSFLTWIVAVLLMFQTIRLIKKGS